MFALTLIDDSHRYVFKTGWSQRNISEIRSSRFFFRASGNREMTKKKRTSIDLFSLGFSIFSTRNRQKSTNQTKILSRTIK